MLQGSMIEKLKVLRERLKKLGQRPSMQFPSASPVVIEAIELVERYGAMCEAMYLMMAADGRVLNVEREVLRGALDVLSEGAVRTAHMEAMLDASARASAVQGTERRIEEVIGALQGEPVRAELVVLLCAAVALADGTVDPKEERLFQRFADGLGLGEQRALALLGQLEEQIPPTK